MKLLAMKLAHFIKRFSISKYIITMVVSCVFISQAQAGMRQYRADLNSSIWELSVDSRLECTLAHQIPHYGKAKFQSKASRQQTMDFELDMLLLPDNYSLAEVRSVAPSWRPGIGSKALTDMKLQKQFSPTLPKKLAWTMLSELEQGMNPTFYYNDWYSEDDKISVALSTAKFKQAYHKFVGCLGNLLNYNFDDIKYTVLNYDFGGSTLTKASKRRMAMITQYLALDPSLDLVLIDGFNDSYGGRDTNDRLSKLRAEKIRDYMVKSGIEPSRIEAKGYGEKRHIASNKTVTGRAQNRRVVIRMDKP